MNAEKQLHFRTRPNWVRFTPSLIPYQKTPHSKFNLPERSTKDTDDDQAPQEGWKSVPEKY